MLTRSGDGRHGARSEPTCSTTGISGAYYALSRRPHREKHGEPGRQRQEEFKQSGNTDDDSLYRGDRLTDDTQTIYVPEGEKDVHAIEWAGGTAVTSAQGARSAHKFDWSPLKGHDVIIVVDLHRGARWLVG